MIPITIIWKCISLPESITKNHEIYTDMFGIFKDAFLALRDANVYNKLAGVCAKHWGS
jgi:hypothetical protein